MCQSDGELKSSDLLFSLPPTVQIHIFSPTRTLKYLKTTIISPWKLQALMLAGSSGSMDMEESNKIIN